MHKLSRAIAMMGLLAPVGASALGVGDIRLHSGLNQSLNAEIPLVLSGADTLKDVKVALADPDAFAKAGVERHYFLTKLQFNAIQKSDGQYAIQVSSRDVLREPFLNFLVEVNWPQGRVLREFTVLLDPPASMPEEAVAEIAPPMVGRPYGATYPRVAEISRADETPAVRRPARRAVTVAPERNEAPVIAVPPPSAEQLTGDSYGPVQRGENLWSIVRALPRDPSISPEQMVVGLFRANPQAFAGNINALKAGALLRIPTPEYLAQFGPHRGAVKNASRGSESAASHQDEPPQNQLKLLSPSEAKSRGETAVAGNETSPGGKIKGDLALEVAETLKQENEEFRSRLIQLEQKLEEMQRLITLKDEQIATIQQQRSAAQASAEVPQKPATLPVQPAETPAVPAQPSAVPQQPAPSATPQPPVQERPAPSEPEAVKPPEAPPPKVSPKTAPPPVPPKPSATTPAVAEEPGFPIDSSYLIAGGSLALLGLGAWLIKRRRNALIAETESILLAAERESLQPSQVPVSRAAESGLEPIVATKSSFLSEFTPSDFDALGTETDDMDPISEADVYLAYGRYKQAEELIRHAIEQHPERDENKLKLLEIYQATENRAAFESYAQELKAAHKDAQPEFWTKVVEMGRELIPGSSLFEAHGQRQQKPKREYSKAAQNLGALDLSDDLIDDLKRFEIEFVAPATPATEQEDFLPLSFDIEAESEKEKGTSDADDGNSLEFDLASLYPNRSKASPEALSKKEAPELENLIPFDFGKTQPPEKAPSSQSGLLFDDILRDLGGHAENEREKYGDTPEVGSVDADRPLGTLGFKLDLLEPGSGLKETGQSEAGSDETARDSVFAELTDMDQYETKLDLAKAYVDMEDEDSAREILQEVLTGGDERQRTEAAALLSKMGTLQAHTEFSMPEPKISRI